jgi:hypothetical protein
LLFLGGDGADEDFFVDTGADDGRSFSGDFSACLDGDLKPLLKIMQV